MIVLDNLGKLKKGYLWIDNLPDIKYETNKTLNSYLNTNKKLSIEECNTALEILLTPRECSNYAFLGCKYRHSEHEGLEVVVKLSDKNGPKLNDRLSLASDEVHAGIPKEYGIAIIETIEKMSKELDLPSGFLTFDIGAHAYVGSSKMVFSKVTEILLRLFSFNLKENNQEQLKKYVGELIGSK